MGASGVNGSSKVGVCGSEDAGKEDGNNKTNNPGLKAVRPRLGSSYSTEEGRSSSVGQLVRPALPGRNVHRKTSSEGNRGRQREGIQERDEERQNVEHVEGRKTGEQRHRKTERTDTYEHKALSRQEGGSSESVSCSNCDIHLNSGLEVGEGSNNWQRRQTCPRSGPSRTSITTLNEQSPQRLSSRTATGDLHCHSFSSSREPDPFWVKVRTEAAARRSAQSHHTQTHITTLTGSELGDEEEDEEDEEEQDIEDGEDGGSGVMEVMSQTMTQAVVLPCVPFGERRMSKREKNRIKCLRRRQRRRQRWRQSQQESRQVMKKIS